MRRNKVPNPISTVPAHNSQFMWNSNRVGKQSFHYGFIGVSSGILPFRPSPQNQNIPCQTVHSCEFDLGREGGQS